MNRPDLITQLEKLTPTEGEWEELEGLIAIKGQLTTLYSCEDDSTQDDDKLITLAPAMRIEILAMAKEIEELKAEKKRMQFIIDNGLGERDLTNDI